MKYYVILFTPDFVCVFKSCIRNICKRVVRTKKEMIKYKDYSGLIISEQVMFCLLLKYNPNLLRISVSK